MKEQPGLLARLNEALRLRVLCWLFPAESVPLAYQYRLGTEGYEHLREKVRGLSRRRPGDPAWLERRG